MGPLPGPRLPLGPLLPSSSVSLLASLSATQAEGALSLEISFLWRCPSPTPAEAPLGRNRPLGGFVPPAPFLSVGAGCRLWSEGRKKAILSLAN